MVFTENMSRSNKKNLVKVSIGAYITDNRGRQSVEVNDSEPCIRAHALYDQAMGYLNKPGWPACDGDHAACFGRMGYIPLRFDILNPAFDTAMLSYLALFEYIPGDNERAMLRMREGVAELVEKHKTLKGYRRLKAISEDIVPSNPWKIWDERGGVRYKIRNKRRTDDQDEYVDIPGIELKELLATATRRYSDENANVTLRDIGINTDVAKPEDFVRGDIPILPNIMRAPQKGSDLNTAGCVKGKHHPFTDHYANIIDAARTGDAAEIRREWMNLIKNGETDNLKSAVFSSEKRAFLRGGMFAKVGGQIARSVVAPNPRQRPDQVGIPRRLARDVSFRVPVTEENTEDIVQLIQQGHITHILHTRTGEYIRVDEFSNIRLEPGRMLVLRELADGDVVLINRQPTLHKNSILGFEVYLHDYDVIYIHPSATKSFGMDFDGDEGNAIFPYTPLGMREVRELMFVEFHMASLASSSLLVGYHQDVNLAAHMLTMEGNFVPVSVWNEMARISYETRWADRYATYDEWFNQFQERIQETGIEMYSGRSLYSTLLPEDMEWSMNNARITRGILTHGLLESKTTSGASSSIGMVMYRTYGSRETVSWLNGSYRMLNLYLVQRGITLGFPHLLLTEEQQERINAIKNSVAQRRDLRVNSEDIIDPVLRARTESEVAQELSNARETVSVEVMNPKDINLTLDIRGRVIGDIVLYRRNYNVLPNCEMTGVCVQNDPMLDMPFIARIEPINMQIVDQFLGNTSSEQDNRSATLIPLVERITIPVGNVDIVINNDEEFERLNSVNIDLYSGSITWTRSLYDDNNGDMDEGSDSEKSTYTWSMGLFPRIELTLVTKEIRGDETFYARTPVDRSYVTPNPLRIMIESGARGNATNAIQIAGIIGQQSFGGGRIPRMLESSQTARTATMDTQSPNFRNMTGPRSMPCYVFGENSPVSRGFIAESYLRGMRADSYMSAHVASRENLTSNTDLTPRTGYFERRVRTFTENLRISTVNGKTVVTNERGVIVMWDYLLDPSRVFSVGRDTTFVDLNFELRSTKSYTQGTYNDNKVLFLYVPFRERMSAYTAIDTRIQQILSLPDVIGTDVVIACDPQIEFKHPDFYEYLRDLLPETVQTGQERILENLRQGVDTGNNVQGGANQRGRGARGGPTTRSQARDFENRVPSDIVVFSLAPSIPEAQRLNFFLSMTEYQNVVVVPVDNRNMDLETVSRLITNPGAVLPQGASAALNVTSASIYGISHPAPRGRAIPINILYAMLTYGTDFTRFPFVVRPNAQTYSMLAGHSLLETLLLAGDIYTL